MIGRHRSALLAALLVASPVAAQSLDRRIANLRDGSVQFTFASRSGVCGDGATFLSDGLGGSARIFQEGNFTSRRDADWRTCIPGPIRVVALVSDGDVTRLRTYAGPTPANPDADRRDLGTVAVADAADFLKRLVERARGRASSDAILPLVLADSIDPWPLLLRFARDDRLPKAVRSSTDFWLARGAAAALGVSNHDGDDEDDVRSSAVFALSQQPREAAVPKLIEIVHHSSRPAVRAQALFWLGQSGDPAAIDLFEEILRR